MKRSSYRVFALCSVPVLAGAILVGGGSFHSSQASTDIPISVSGEVYTPGSDIVTLPADVDPAQPAALVCRGASPKDSYAIGFQGVLDMTNVWTNYEDMATYGRLTNAAAFNRLVITGEWTTSMTVDTNVVDINTLSLNV